MAAETIGGMALSRAAAALDQAVRLLGAESPDELAIRQAAWVARCVGRGEMSPLAPQDLAALASTLTCRRFPRGAVVFHGGEPTAGVWIVQHGRVELSVGSGRRRTVVHVLRPGDVDGDIPLLLGMPLPYSARALDDATLLSLTPADFDRPPAAGRGRGRPGRPPAADAGRHAGSATPVPEQDPQGVRT